MSLSLPNNYKRSNINENWLFQIFNSRDSFLSFDGSNDFIDYGTTDSTITALTSNITIAFYVKFPTSSLGSGTYVFLSNTKDDHWTGFNIYKDQNDQMSLLVSDGTANTNYVRIKAGTIVANTWYHILITSNLSASPTTDNTKIYINNVVPTQSKSDSGSISGVGYHASGKTMFGKLLKPDPDAYYGFSIKNFAIWNTQLDSNNRTSVYNSGTPKSVLNDFGGGSGYTQSSALKVYWEFNNGDFTSTDLTGNISTALINGCIYDGYLPLAYKDTKVNNLFYSGSIVSKGSVIRDSINLENSTAQSSNVSIVVYDFKYQGNNVSEDLLFSDNNYINKTVKIYSQPDDNSNLSNCIQIYTGRLTNLSINDNKTINLDITSKQPWDFITAPIKKSSTNNIYFPVVYGNYTPETSTDASPQFVNDAVTIGSDYSGAIVHPIPQDRVIGENIKFLTHEDILTDGTDKDTRGHYYESNYDFFVPIDPPDDTAEVYGGGGCINVPTNLKREFKTQDYEINSSTTFNDSSNVKHATNYATARLQVTNGSVNTVLTDAEYVYLDLKMPDGKVTNINITFDYILNRGAIALSSPSTKDVRIIDDSAGNGTVLVDQTINASHTDPLTGSVNANLSGASVIQQIVLKYQLRLSDTNVSTNHALYDVSIRNVVVTIKCEADQSGEPEAFAKKLEDLNKIYCGSDGHNKSYLGGSGIVTDGLSAHRDILARYVGFDTFDDSIYNWSTNFPSSNSLNISSLRSAWSIRWWQLEPTEIKKILEEIQKEFCFIFKFRPDGSASYWVVKDSYSSGDVVCTLNLKDISDLKIKHTPFSSLLTKMIINYNYHPAKENYLSQITSEDTTNSVRTKLNIRDKENIKEVSLKMNTDKAGNVDVGSGNSNDGYSDYYMNIFGDVKKIISCSIVNSSKGYLIETGDIIKFNINDIKPFGGNWNDYYMVTNVQRSIGKINITCREVA
tara:strand:- start:1134 stop:4016 length:2883 start_codon:yes stop_codon:yes gene_type:complete